MRLMLPSQQNIAITAGDQVWVIDPNETFTMTTSTMTTTPTRELSYAEAIREGLRQAMERDDRVFILGEDIGVSGGAFGVPGALVHQFGPERVLDTPISELGIAGAAIGAALAGMRPIAEIQFSDFI